jgi:NAD(P)-dependent dehydrogenase (short-subunit alcohol dehydrogenase family)
MTCVVITGASRGIGRATAIAAGERGWSVLVNYRETAEAAEEAAVAVRQAGGRALLRGRSGWCRHAVSSR